MKITRNFIVVILVSCLLSIVFVSATEASSFVNIMLPETRISKFDAFEMKVQISGIDENIEHIRVYALGFEITDCRGNTNLHFLDIDPADLSREALNSDYSEVIVLKWAFDSSLNSGSIKVAIENDSEGKIVQTEDGQYMFAEGYSDMKYYVLNDKYIAFGETETIAENHLYRTSIWLVTIVVGILLVVIAVMILFCSRKLQICCWLFHSQVKNKK